MMLLNDLRDPAAAESPDLDELRAAVIKAFRDAADPGDRSRRAGAWHFYVLEEETAASLAWLAARSMERQAGVEGARAAYEQWRAVPGWVVVTSLRHEDPDMVEAAREAARTAVQRASLALWSENLPSRWDPDLVPDDPAFLAVMGADPSSELPVGVLLYGHRDGGT